MLTAALHAQGVSVSEAAVTDAERRARVRVDQERAAQVSRETAVGGRYLRYLLDELGITDEAQRHAVAQWRRGYNLPVGLCDCADPEALDALRRVRAAGLATGVISNSNGSARQGLEVAGLGEHLDFVVDSTVVGVSKPDPRAFHLGLAEARAEPADAASAWRPTARTLTEAITLALA